MRFSMTVRTKCDAVPVTVALLGAQNMMNIEEASIALPGVAIFTLTFSAGAVKYGISYLTVASDFRSQYPSALCPITTIGSKLQSRAIVKCVIHHPFVPTDYRHPYEILHSRPIP